MGRVSRSEADWQARIELAEALGAVVLTDMKTSASFPTEHPLHPIEPRFRPSPAVADILKQADVILSLDWIDLKGEFHQTLGQNEPVPAKVIHCSLDRYVHNGWSMDYYGLPPADLPILASPDMLVPPLLAAVRKRRGTDAPAAPKWPRASRRCPAGAAERADDDAARPRARHPRVQEGPHGDDPDLFARLAVGDRAASIIRSTISASIPAAASAPDRAIASGSRSRSKAPAGWCSAVIGDGDYAMASNAFWTAAHMEIPMLVVVANNRSYYNDVAHQERMAVVRNRPVANKFIGQEMIEPDLDIVAIAKGHGIDGEGPVERAADLAAALKRGEAAVRAGKTYLIDARVDVRTQDAARGEHTKGRQK